MKDALLRLITALIAKGVITIEELQAVDELIDIDLKDGIDAPRRLTSPRKVKCEDSDGNLCHVIASLRGDQVSIRCEGGDEWAHITKEQAFAMGQWLIQASK